VPRRFRNLLLFILFAAAHGLAWSGFGDGLLAVDADCRSQVAVRAAGPHLVSAARLKDPCAGCVPCRDHDVVAGLELPAFSTCILTDGPWPVRDVDGAVPLASRPPPLV
jgi:hypothetical protein